MNQEIIELEVNNSIWEAVGCSNKATVELTVNVGRKRNIQLFFCKDCVSKCSEFLHDPSNKITPSPYGLCTQQPFHPGCPQITDPERYCLTTDDQAFCRTIGDICDADGFVKAEDAYCTDT